MMKEVHEYFDACHVANELVDFKPRHIRFEMENPHAIVIHKKIKITGKGLDVQMAERRMAVIKMKQEKIHVKFSIHQNDKFMRKVIEQYITEHPYDKHSKLLNTTHFSFDNLEDFIQFFDRIFWKPTISLNEYIKNKFQK